MLQEAGPSRRDRKSGQVLSGPQRFHPSRGEHRLSHENDVASTPESRDNGELVLQSGKDVGPKIP